LLPGLANPLRRPYTTNSGTTHILFYYSKKNNNAIIIIIALLFCINLIFLIVRWLAAEEVVATLAGRVIRGERRAVAQAVTLVESSRHRDRRTAEALLARLATATAAPLSRHPTTSTFRVGISGPPGVGKVGLPPLFSSLPTR
jgi:hypothetical protein